mgnify:CR=1 FL=1
MVDKFLDADNTIAAKFIANHTRNMIIEKAMNDCEKPFGYVICWLRDNGLHKTSPGYATARAILRYYNIQD